MARQGSQTSKFLSLILRHEPEAVGITLDEGGWVVVDDLLAALARHGKPLSRGELEEIVATNDKKRFAFNDDGTQIRASQGHSVEVELAYQPATPPALLHHGTVERFLASIRAQGLIRGQRHHVHLSADDETAARVGARRGRPVVLTIDAAAMFAAAHLFYRSENGVWLTEHVPPIYIRFPA